MNITFNDKLTGQGKNDLLIPDERATRISEFMFNTIEEIFISALEAKAANHDSQIQPVSLYIVIKKMYEKMGEDMTDNEAIYIAASVGVAIDAYQRTLSMSMLMGGGPGGGNEYINELILKIKANETNQPNQQAEEQFRGPFDGGIMGIPMMPGEA